MQSTKRRGGRPRLLARIAATSAAMMVAGTLSVVAAQPAAAASCQTDGHVYVTDRSPISIRYENDAVDGPTSDYQNFGGYGFTVFFRLGGNGLARDSIPSWDVRSNTGSQFTLFGNKAGSNCVSNEKNFSRGAGAPGEIWTVTANYNTGNTSRLIRNQNHFRIFFVDPPPPPPDPPSPGCNPDICWF